MFNDFSQMVFYRVADFVKHRSGDIELRDAAIDRLDHVNTLRAPFLDLVIQTTPEGLVLSQREDMEKELFLWEELMRGHPVRPPIEILHKTMFRGGYEQHVGLFGNQVGKWSLLKMPGFVWMIIWDTLIVYNKG